MNTNLQSAVLSLVASDAAPLAAAAADNPFSAAPPWAVMWAIAIAIFALAKGLSFLPARRLKSSPARRLGYFLFWPGLDAPAFLAPAGRTAKVAGGEWPFALGKTLLGVALLIGGTKLAGDADSYLVGWIGMIGVVFTLHFGLFHLLSCLWRSRGVDAPPLMDWPVRSKSVSEFWGKRWNRAFRDLTHRFVFRLLVARLGLTAGSLLAFLFSGLIHELAITVPAGAGYGGPTLYFFIQGIGLLAERSIAGKHVGLGAGWRGRLFALAVVALPVPLLFPRAFVTEVAAPFLQALGTMP